MFCKNIFLLSLFALLFGVGVAQDNHSHVVTDIVFDGLKVTKPHILHREITFVVGDTLSSEALLLKIERSEQNLNNLRLFHRVTSDLISIGDGKVMVLFTFIERFYTIPVPIFKFEEPNFSTWWKDKNFERTSYGLEINRRNFRGRNETVVLHAQMGFTKKISFAYYFPYITKQQNLGMYFQTYLDQNDDVVYGTLDDKRQFFSDSLQKSKEEKLIGIGFTYRKALYAIHDVNLSFRNVQLSDSLSHLNRDYLLGGDKEKSYATLFYRYSYKKTNSKLYPLTGSQLEVKLTQFGLGMAPSGFHVFTIRPTINKFWKLRKDMWFHSGLSLKYSFYDKLPYRIQEGLGFGDTFVRGYEFYVVDGQHYALWRNNIKFCLLSPKLVKIPKFRSDKLNELPVAVYLNAHTDFGYVRNTIKDSPLANLLIRGSGLGIDLVLPYDQIWRLEFSVNDRSERGIFVAYTKSI